MMVLHGIQKHPKCCNWNTIYIQHSRSIIWKESINTSRTESRILMITILVFERSVRYFIYNWLQFFISMYNSVTLTGSNDFYFEFNGGREIALM